MRLIDFSRTLKSEDSKVVASEEATSRLTELPGWAIDGAHLKVTFEFPTDEIGSLFAGYLVELGHLIDYVPKIEREGQLLTVKVSRTGKGLRESDFTCAKLFDPGQSRIRF